LSHSITPDDLMIAARRLEGVAAVTPIIRSAELDERLGAEVFLKAEQFQRGGAFKFRGAFNAVSSLSASDLARGVVAASSGNHAQALALAANLAGTTAVVFMPADAPASKRAGAERYGASVIEFDRYTDDRDALTRELSERTGRTIVHPFNDPSVIAGAGTSTMELLDDAGPLDLMLIPVGGGGQLSGGAIAAGASPSPPQVIGVEPRAVGAWRRSLAAGRPIVGEVARTIADGQQLAAPGGLAFDVVHRLDVRIVGVDDDQIRSAMRYLFERGKLVAEPSGSCALAAALSGVVNVSGRRVGIILSGGNVSMSRFSSLLAADPGD
jgi:threonine dehydratase